LPEGTPSQTELDTDELRRQERAEKLAIRQAKAEAKLAKADAKLAKDQTAALKKQFALARAERDVQLARSGQKRGWFGRVVRVRAHTRGR
jgi:hypothetical protein